MGQKSHGTFVLSIIIQSDVMIILHNISVRYADLSGGLLCNTYKRAGEAGGFSPYSVKM